MFRAHQEGLEHRSKDQRIRLFWAVDWSISCVFCLLVGWSEHQHKTTLDLVQRICFCALYLGRCNQSCQSYQAATIMSLRCVTSLLARTLTRRRAWKPRSRSEDNLSFEVKTCFFSGWPPYPAGHQPWESVPVLYWVVPFLVNYPS